MRRGLIWNLLRFAIGSVIDKSNLIVLSEKDNLQMSNNIYLYEVYKFGIKHNVGKLFQPLSSHTGIIIGPTVQWNSL